MAFDNGELSSMWMGMENCGVFLRPASAARMATHPRTASSDGILGRILGRQGGEVFDVACRGPRLLLEQLQPQDHAGRAPACSPHPRASARAPSPPPLPPTGAASALGAFVPLAPAEPGARALCPHSATSLLRPPPPWASSLMTSPEVAPFAPCAMAVAGGGPPPEGAGGEESCSF